MSRAGTLLPPDQYRLLVESSPVLIWRSRADGACDYFNETWLAFTGRALADELGDGWTASVHAGDVEARFGIYREHLARRSAFEVEYRMRRRDGVYRWVSDRGVPIHGADGRFAGFIGSCIDVHDRRAAELARGTFLALLAHEQRTPLTALFNYLELARRRADAPAETLDRMVRQCDRMARLVDKLADTARLEAGHQLELDLATVDLVAVVERAVAERALLVRERVDTDRGHRVELRVAARPLPVRGDADRLAEAVGHVLENALKFSPRGGEVVVDVAAGAPGARITVTDPGIGIAAEDLAHIGRRYFRAANAPPEHFPGIGLGLAMTREIIEQHGGRLAITSEPGHGTVVTLVLPEVAP